MRTFKPSAEAALELMHGLVAYQVLHHLADMMHGEEMTFTQFNALCRLLSDGPQSIASLAEASAVSHPSASRMVERLVQAGLVERRELPSDRRQKRVDLTTEGRQRLLALKDITTRAYADLLAQVPAETLERVTAVLEELGTYLPPHPLLRYLEAAEEDKSKARDRQSEDQRACP